MFSFLWSEHVDLAPILLRLWVLLGPPRNIAGKRVLPGRPKRGQDGQDQEMSKVWADGRSIIGLHIVSMFNLYKVQRQGQVLVHRDLQGSKIFTALTHQMSHSLKTPCRPDPARHPPYTAPEEGF